LHLLASHNTPPALVEARRHTPLRPGANDPIGRMITTKTVIHTSDAMAEQAYTDEHDPGRQLAAAVDLGGARTILAIPMLDGERTDRFVHRIPPGGSSLYRQADRTCHELRQPSRHCHREHTAAQRTAGIAAAADRHCRRTKGDQPLDLRSPISAQHFGRIGCPSV
jgi:hypothetical protein